MKIVSKNVTKKIFLKLAIFAWHTFWMSPLLCRHLRIQFCLKVIIINNVRFLSRYFEPMPSYLRTFRVPYNIEVRFLPHHLSALQAFSLFMSLLKSKKEIYIILHSVVKCNSNGPYYTTFNYVNTHLPPDMLYQIP